MKYRSAYIEINKKFRIFPRWGHLQPSIFGILCDEKSSFAVEWGILRLVIPRE